LAGQNRGIEIFVLRLKLQLDIESMPNDILSQWWTEIPLLQRRREASHSSQDEGRNDRFAAESEAYPPTLEIIFWIVAKRQTRWLHLWILSEATRECNLQRYMRELMNERVINEDTSSAVRMLELRSIDVEAKEGEDGFTCLMTAAGNGHPAIWRLLINKGAQLEAKNSDGWVQLHWAAFVGHVEIVRLFCDCVEARSNGGWRTLHRTTYHCHISVVKELIDERNAEINELTEERNGEIMQEVFMGERHGRLPETVTDPTLQPTWSQHGGILWVSDKSLHIYTL